MLTLAFPFIFIAGIALVWLATRSAKHGVRVVWTVIVLLCGCLASVRMGMSIGSAVSRCQLMGPIRALGSVFPQIQEEMKNGDLETAKARIDMLSDKWYSVDFFDQKPVEGIMPWNVFVSDIQRIKKAPEKLPAVTPAESSR